MQIRHELPSHIIMPAVHLTKEQIEADFRRVHTHLPADRDLERADQTLLTEARAILRDRFLAADVGITGANFLVAETGTSIIVTNEGNGDLTQTLPRVHIVLASIEKVVPTLEDVSQIAARAGALGDRAGDVGLHDVLDRSAPRRRSGRAGRVSRRSSSTTAAPRCSAAQFREMLRCIRCGACMNHCPVYAAVGGHTYGWVYPGPMGAVLTPSIVGIENAGHLPNASTFCGRCEEVCPVRIPLPKLMRHWREREFERHLSPATVRTGLGVWGFFATRPRLYAVAMSLAMFGPRPAGQDLRPLPLAAARRRLDAASRFPAPEVQTFQAQWKRRAEREGAMSARDTILSAIRSGASRSRVAGRRTLARAARRRSCDAPRLRAAHSARRHPGARAAAAAGAGQAVRRDGRGRGRHGREILPTPTTCPPRSRRCLRRHNLPMQVRRGDDPRLAALPWERERTLEVSTGASDGHQLAAVSHAFAGVAETGTLVMASGPDNPTTLNFLPDTHIVVVDAEGHRGRLRDGVGARPRDASASTRCRARST